MDNQKPTGDEALAILEAAQKAGHLPEGFIEEQLAAVRGGIQDETHSRVEAAGKVQEKRELEPAQVEQLMEQLKSNFTNNGREFPKLHPNAKWAEVEASLRAQPEMMWSLSKMEETGGRVDVIGEDDGGFLFGDTSRESPDGRRNVVYDRKAEDDLKRLYPDETCNGNAEDTAASWGVELESEEQYRALQGKVPLDARTWSWLKTPQDIRDVGLALYGFRDGEYVGVDRFHAFDRGDGGGFRCALRVKKSV